MRPRTPFKIIEERNEMLSQEVKKLREEIFVLESKLIRTQNALDTLYKEVNSLIERSEADGE